MIDRRCLKNLKNKNVIEVKLGDIHTLHRHRIPFTLKEQEPTLDSYSSTYPWEKLKESLVKEGHNPKKYGYIKVRPKYNGIKYDIKRGKWVGTTDFFEITDGNHRVRVLKNLYGNDYKIMVVRDEIFKIMEG